ncbi:6-hydroxymethylpterin diphosphokinase MptE-like protein [Pseudodesulfovibrio pelocollis]|uniref:6-hydroxymethylpterin diphosphokinase MptE-like protein n=1 Tax=Pseudodesulfovibrio pelocollis TaxID=3051432 RepID=UPI00255B06E7|nr:6-hydroxymethylpterin diphosphokinase MptE-like protein [Pseudodesulfovibrio sp. SB368]
MLTTCLDLLTKDHIQGNPLVITLGACQVEAGVSPARALPLPDAGPDSMSAIGRIPLAEFRDGAVLVVSSSLAESDYPAVRRIQKHLVFCLIKYVWFPCQDTATPDPLGLGGDKGPLADLLYQINAMENLPHLLSWPRAKSLAGSLPPMPVLLLLPGDSLNDLAPHLPALAERFLVLCLSKTLAFCRDAGITPDIVVQLDTHGEQANFYPDDMDLSDSWLLALSCIPASRYLHRFAGIFWIDTFDPCLFDNGYEIRNSWLSSFIPMLGVAELLRPASQLVAGADLAFGCRADGPCTDEDQPLSNARNLTAVGPGTFAARLGNGRTGTTTMQFMATAYEAETIAAELLIKGGTVCYNLSRTGLLDPDVFEHAAPDAFLTAPTIDRALFRKGMERASRVGLPKVAGAKRMLYERLSMAETLTRQAEALVAEARPEDLADSPLLSATKLLTHLHPVADTATRVHIALELIRRYRDILRQRITGFRLADWADRGKTLPLLCHPDERDALLTALSQRFPKAHWRTLHTWENNANRTATLKAGALPQFLHDHPVTLISRRYAECADYLLRLLPRDTSLIVEDILAAPWPPGRGQ